MRADVFDVLVVAHAVAAVVGFGAIALSGVYGLTARRRQRPGALEEVQRYFARPPLAEAAVVAVGVLGLAAVGVDPHGGGYGQLWTTAGAVLWLAACALWWLVVRPAERRIGAAVRAQQAEDAVLDAEGTRLSVAATVSSVLFVVALGFMVFQPS